MSGRATVVKNCPPEPMQGVANASGRTYFGSNHVSRQRLRTPYLYIQRFGRGHLEYRPGPGPLRSGKSPPLIVSGCTSSHNKYYSISTNQTLSASRTYTLVVTGPAAAVVRYGLSLERVNPPPTDSAALVLGQTLTGSIDAPTEQNPFIFYGATTGTYKSQPPGRARPIT